ncbi:hypothetical protein [Parvibaculum sp.]|uniref:hypothetical protein n=1 Tax=Parvibaculum sp. TaxID=2024848 RepID=UPI002730703B|nr:hypothetical protein [Parvibaculum sp.]MDP1628820.1 hypothetical protein [Parvibaculum sp.]MDP2148215.1 hypothetical protein [Parvibaculum sp.]MDP3327723.1 hypothetical protein [Parvibaculum sp.]
MSALFGQVAGAMRDAEADITETNPLRRARDLERARTQAAIDTCMQHAANIAFAAGSQRIADLFLAEKGSGS